MDPVSYHPIKAKPKVNVTPNFGAKAPELPETSEEKDTSEPPAFTKKSLSPRAFSSLDLRFALGMVIVIILINTALVVLFSYEKAKGLTELIPPAGEDKPAETVVLEELDTRPSKSFQNLSSKASGTTTYITPERQQILLRPLNGTTSEGVGEFEGEPADRP